MKLFSMLKKVGSFSLLAIGGAITVGAAGIGIAAVVYDDKVKEVVNHYVGQTQSSINAIVNNFDGLVNQYENVSETIFKTFDETNKMIGEQVANIDQLIKQLSNSATNDLASDLQQANKFLVDFQGYIVDLKKGFENGKVQIDDVLNGEIVKTVKDVLNQADSILGSIQDPSSPFWKIYNTISYAILFSSILVLSSFVIGIILRTIYYKKVDGIWVRKTNEKADVKKHIKKILKKYPHLRNVLEEYEQWN